MDREKLLDSVATWTDRLGRYEGEVHDLAVDLPVSELKFDAADSEFGGALMPLKKFFCNVASRVNFTWFLDDYSGAFYWDFFSLEWIDPEEYYWFDELTGSGRSLGKMIGLQCWANGDYLVLLCDGTNCGKIGYFYHDDPDSNLDPFVFGEPDWFLDQWERIGFVSLECYHDFIDPKTGRFGGETTHSAEIRKILIE